MALTGYQQDTQRLLHDPNAQAYSITDINAYINRARFQVAIEGECIHTVLSGGTITSLQLINGGTNYFGGANINFIGPGAQAFATASVNLITGVIAGVTLTTGGWGWIPASALTVTATGPGGIGGGGSGATFTVIVDNSATTVTGQEVVQFSTLNNLLATWNNATGGNLPGLQGMSQVIKIFSIACNQQGTYKPMLTQKSWSEFQAYLRIYSNTQQNYPNYWAQLGQGVNGSIYLFPWPAQPLQLDIQCAVTPIALVNDATPEAIPYPWTDAVAYYAAYLAYMNSSRGQDAKNLLDLYKYYMARARAYSEGPFMPDWYGYEY